MYWHQYANNSGLSTGFLEGIFHASRKYAVNESQKFIEALYHYGCVLDAKIMLRMAELSWHSALPVYL